MKKITILALAFCLAGAAHAGCGTKIDVKGKVTKYDAEKKELTVEGGKKDAPETKVITLEASVTAKDDKGADLKIDDLVGKRVSVSTDKHTQKGESITLAAKKEKPKA